MNSNQSLKIRFQAALALVLFVALGMFVMTPVASAQTLNTGKVLGTVTDQTGAVVPKAEVQLINVGTNATQTATTDDSGGYVFPSVVPGTYRLTVKMSGFRQANVTDLNVDVEKSSTVPVKLEVGGDKEVVEVTASAQAALQTADAQIGNVLSTDNILRLPTLQRNAVELMNLQPGVTAGASGTSGINMRVSGAIDDQNTVTLDGVDITQNVVAGNTSIPTPADSVEEFRANVANPSANLQRGSGGQITLIGRHGSNDFHGAIYEFLQNNDLNSNTWDNNHAGLAKARIDDNRYGARLGGPIQKNKTFFFANYEARRFISATGITRTVPTAPLRAGILQFQNGGVLEQFNLKTAAICGAAGTSACDPRGLGISPSVAAQFADMPLPNLGGFGDTLNTSGFYAVLPTPIQTDYGVMRLDHVFNDKLTLNLTTTYYRSDVVGSTDVSILNGVASSAITSPSRGLVPSAQLTWQISPTFLNVFRLGWVRDTSQSNATSPTNAAGKLNIVGTQTADGPVAIIPGSGVTAFLDAPIDMDTQRARFQAAWLTNGQIYDDMTKILGKHQIQYGVNVNRITFTHARADKVIGSITSLVADLDQGSFLTIPSVNTPLTCGGAVTSNCLPSNQLTNYDKYYASVLGLVDNVGVLAVRNANLQPQPLGTLLRDDTSSWAPYMYVQDSFRLKPNLTLYFGLSYGWQTAPKEANNLQTLMVNTQDNNSLITGPAYIQSKESAALAGQIFNPTLGFETVTQAKRAVYNTDWGQLAPRVSLAWNPSAKGGFMGKLVGEHKTVIRGGFAMVYDRSNQVQAVEIPMLGIGFDQLIVASTPTCAATGPGGSGCQASAGAANPGLSSFRVGVDGTLPLPVATAAVSPIVPAVNQETLSFQVDPNTKVGKSYNFDFSLQRELPGGIIMELAYVGRAARNLPQAVNLNSAPYMFKDSASGQTFAQAYDAVANALRAGQTAPTEPWFENQFPGLATLKGAASATAYIVGANKGLFTAGSVGNLFLNLDTYRSQLKLPIYDNDEAQVEFMRSYLGYSNYNAGIVTLTKRMTHGFTISGNYTYAKALDDGLSNQNNAGFYSNSYNTSVQYGASSYDRRNVFNMYYQYDLPAGKGHMLHTGNFIDQIIGGWYTSGVFSAWTGLPLRVTEGSQVWGGGTSTIGSTDYMVPISSLPSGNSISHNVSNTTTCTNQYNPTGVTVGSGVGGASGSNMDIFSNPGAAYCGFGYVQLSSTGRTGSANPFYGLPFWNFDARLGKTTSIKERYKIGFSADFFNIFNHQNFNNPTLSYASPGSFGVISGTYTPPNRTNAARWIEMGLRLDF